MHKQSHLENNDIPPPTPTYGVIAPHIVLIQFVQEKPWRIPPSGILPDGFLIQVNELSDSEFRCLMAAVDVFS